MSTGTDQKEVYKVYLPRDVGRALRQEKAETRRSHGDIIATALRLHLGMTDRPAAQCRQRAKATA